MKLETAQALFPKVKHLEGINSNNYRSEVDLVFIAFRSFTITTMYLKLYKADFQKSLQPMIRETDEFTIAARLQNEKILSVRNLVAEKLTDLYKDIKNLDYMNL